MAERGSIKRGRIGNLSFSKLEMLGEIPRNFHGYASIKCFKKPTHNQASYRSNNQKNTHTNTHY